MIRTKIERCSKVSIVILIVFFLVSCGRNTRQELTNFQKENYNVRAYLFGNNSGMLNYAEKQEKYSYKCNINVTDLITQILRDKIVQQQIHAEDPIPYSSTSYATSDWKVRRASNNSKIGNDESANNFSLYQITYLYSAKTNKYYVRYAAISDLTKRMFINKSFELNFTFDKYSGNNDEACYNDLKKEIEPIADEFIQKILENTPKEKI